MKILIKKPWSYTLSFDETESQYIISVICGGVAMYKLEMKLNSEEVERFKSDGESFMDILAKDIQKNTRKYETRRFKDPR